MAQLIWSKIFGQKYLVKNIWSKIIGQKYLAQCINWVKMAQCINWVWIKSDP